MAEAIIIREYGGPDVLRPEPITPGAPPPGHVRVSQTFIGVNFHDVYVRTGQYRTLALPGTPGVEGVGVVETVGAGVESLAPGDRIAYVTRRYGSYASHRILPAGIAVRLPGDVDDKGVAGLFVKGLTVVMLLQYVHRLQRGERVLVHAAAGGVGRLLCQWAAHLGARVIGTVGSAAKAGIARNAGCEDVIDYRSEDFAERVLDITAGRGVDVVYDSVGQDTFDGSLESLATRSHLVAFGQASGPVAPFSLSRLSERSTTLSRPILFDYFEQRADIEAMSSALFAALAAGVLRCEEPRVFALRDAAEAHRALESRRVTAPVVLAAQAGEGAD